MATLHIGFVIFDDVTQLDFTGPLEVLAKLPDSKIHLVARDLNSVTANTTRLKLIPTITFDDCPQLDIVCVPGGPGHLKAMEDAATLAFLKRQAPDCRYVTSVCTGALVLAAAGLLKGYRATTHWAAHHRLAQFGAIPEKARTVIDRNRMTGGGVTAGIDFALRLATELVGEKLARTFAAQIEYLPDPPFPDLDPPHEMTPGVSEYMKKAQAIIAETDARAVTRLSDN